jgi:hypothetical protein
MIRHAIIVVIELASITPAIILLKPVGKTIIIIV